MQKFIVIVVLALLALGASAAAAPAKFLDAANGDKVVKCEPRPEIVRLYPELADGYKELCKVEICQNMMNYCIATLASGEVVDRVPIHNSKKAKKA